MALIYDVPLVPPLVGSAPHMQK